jgi:hypothetical protein
MKKAAFLAFALVSCATHALELSFSDMALAVSTGQQISFVLDLKQCTSDTTLPDAVASYTSESALVVGNNRITASHRHFTLDEPGHRGTPIFENIKYNINRDGNVQVIITSMNAINYDKLSSMQIHCNLGKGFKAFA